jgi:D-alanyl-D-alanine carboxypeptidase
MPPSALPESELDAATATAFQLCAGTPGAVVGVHTPAGTWFGTYGQADPDSPITAHTHLRIGSVTKTFTATILLQLAEEGALRLDDALSMYLPDTPDTDGITLRLLATMRSGIADYTADPGLIASMIADPTAVHDTDHVIKVGLAAPRAFAPDTQFAYSNTNYAILGKILEQVSGKSFATLLSERILGPLGLSNTSWPGESASMPAPFARGYTLVFPGATPAQPVDTTDFNPCWASTAGALVSTAQDLLTYATALGTGALLTAETQAMRIASLADASALAPGVEYGIGLMRISGWIGHSGHIPGYRAACYYHPQAQAAAVVLTAGDIVAGNCPPGFAGATITTDAPCMAATARLFDAVSAVLGQPSNTPTGMA